MRPTDVEIIRIKQAMAEMWQLASSQIKKAHEALLSYDTECAHEVITREKSVNSYELFIDKECENFIALFTPVAIDLRFVLSLMKINNNIERIGDFAEGIAKYVLLGQKEKIDAELIKSLRLVEMFNEVQAMFELCKKALAAEDTVIAARVFRKDNLVDEINRNAVKVLAAYCQEHPEKLEQCFDLYASIRRTERMGDRCVNIAEDIIFYVDAKELRHTEKKSEKEKMVKE